MTEFRYPPVLDTDADDAPSEWEVVATGSSTARALRDRAADVVNVKDYGAVGDGVADDTTALRAALAKCGSGQYGTAYIPKGTYRTDTLTIPSWCSVVGDGWINTRLRPTNNNNPVILFDRATSTASGYQNEIRGLHLWGYATGTGAGIYGTGNVGSAIGPSGLRIRDVYIDSFGGNGLHLEAAWNASISNVQASNSLGHQFFVGSAINTVAFYDCYAKGVPTAGKAGWRIEQGRVTLVNANGIDSGQFWGIFGSEIAEGDAQDARAYVSILGSNVEDFTDTGIVLRRNGHLSIDNTSFGAPDAGTVRALYTNNFNSTQPVIWGIGNRISTKGASWANGFPCHAKLAPNMVKFGSHDFSSVWSKDAAYSVAVPSITGTDLQGELALSTRIRVLAAIVTRTTPTYGATITINAALGQEFVITATDGVAFFVSSPTNSTAGQRITVRIRNTSGGALGAVTWGGNYRMATWTSPANGQSRSIDFQNDGSNWIEVSRTPADVPN